MSDGDSDATDPTALSEDLVQSPQHKLAGETLLDFDGLLKKPLRLYEDLSKGCGGQLWPAGMVLTKYLLHPKQLDVLRGKSILEIGAGGGLTGLALAIALSDDEHTMHGTGHIEMTDMDAMLDLMKRNITLNELPSTIINASILDWGTSYEMNSPPDIVLAADCVYFEPAFPLLLQTMSQIIGPKTTCFFCFKRRRKADMRFMKDAKKLFIIEDVMDDPDRAVWSREQLFLYKITKRSTS